MIKIKSKRQKHKHGKKTVKSRSRDKRLPGSKSFHIIVVGASAGGFNAILDFADHLPSDTGAAIFIVQHLSAQSNIAYLAQHLQQHTSFTCKLATNGETIKSGTVYIAVPGVHLVISGNKMVYGTGPDENRFKPSIDVLFRSAAVEYKERVIGIILSGLLDDGVTGMSAIKRCGGQCIVQDPAEAEYGDMPLAVMDKVKPDYCLPAAAMGNIIRNLTRTRVKKAGSVPKELAEEAEIAQKVLTNLDQTRQLGTESLFTCPDCGGVMFHIHDNKLSRYRCFTGHAYTENTFIEKQNESIQGTLWVALRLFEERKKLLSQIRSKAPVFQERQRDIEDHIEKLKELLSDLQKITGATAHGAGEADQHVA